jgi:hypothetical protein
MPPPMMADLALTPIEEALVDFQKGQADMARRRKQMGDPAVLKIPEDAAGYPWPPQYVDALTRPVRLEISFSDPLHARQQLEAAMAGIIEALVVTQDHKRGIVRQRMDLRNIIKTTADVLVLMNGKAPTGKKTRKS